MYSLDWPIRTERLLLRPFEDGDLEALHAIQSDVEVVRYLYEDVRSLNEVRPVLARKIASVSIAGEGDGISAAAVLRGTGELVADVSPGMCVEILPSQGSTHDQRSAHLTSEAHIRGVSPKQRHPTMPAAACLYSSLACPHDHPLKRSPGTFLHVGGPQHCPND